MEKHQPTTLCGLEKYLVLLEQAPWNVLYRIGIGYALVPVVSQFSGEDRSGWHLVVWFLGVLFTLRLLPAIARMIVPFSREAREIWTERRRVAKDFDSYQWQKLTWFGVGLAVFMSSSGNVDAIVLALTSFCLICGGFAFYVWRRKAVLKGAGGA